MGSLTTSAGYIALPAPVTKATVGLEIDRNAMMAQKKNATSIDKASKDFEAMFMAQMLQPMFESVEVNGIFGGGHGEEVMRGMMVQEYGKSLAANSNSKISDAVKSEMIRVQARTTGAASANSEVTQ